MEGYKYINISASALVKTGAGIIRGIVVNSHSSGTIKLWDNTSAATTVICNTITLAAGERYIPMYSLSFNVGLYITVGGTVDLTFIYN